jgi:hypothetical protein
VPFSALNKRNNNVISNTWALLVRRWVKVVDSNPTDPTKLGFWQIHWLFAWFTAFFVFTNPTAYNLDAETLYLLRNRAINAPFGCHITHSCPTKTKFKSNLF